VPRCNTQITKTPELRLRAVLGNNGDREVRWEWGQGKRLVEGALSETNPYAVRTSPRDSQSYDALRVRFSATLGEEPEIEVGLG
jgi:hypothetical protein